MMIFMIICSFRFFVAVAVSLLLFTSCSVSTLAENIEDTNHIEVNNTLGKRLFIQMQQQTDSYMRFCDILEGHIPLYEYARIAFSNEYGFYYSVPYKNKDGVIKGMILLPVYEALTSNKQQLGIPVKLDTYLLNHELDYSVRYLYSEPFKNLQDLGFTVDQELTSFANKVDQQQDANRKANLTKKKTMQFSPQMSYTSITNGKIVVNYQISSYSYWDGELNIISMLPSHLVEKIQKMCYNQWGKWEGAQLSVEDVSIFSSVLYFDFTLTPPLIEFGGWKISDYFNAFFREISMELGNEYHVNVSFYYYFTQLNSMTSGPVVGPGGSSSGGVPGAGASGGSNGGSNDGSTGGDNGIGSEILIDPCRNDSTGKANPLGYMQLMPPNSYNIAGARFGNTRTGKNGKPKFHQGIDLDAVPGTPIYALFDGIIDLNSSFITSQPNRIMNDEIRKAEYPDEYRGDRNDAGNRFSVRHVINGKEIVVSYWHLHELHPVVVRAGRELAPGDSVMAGDLIGYTGVTGNSDPERPHLHFGIKKNGEWIDPAFYLNAEISPTSIKIVTPCD